MKSWGQVEREWETLMERLPGGPGDPDEPEEECFEDCANMDLCAENGKRMCGERR